jgi:hypothetical protein
VEDIFSEARSLGVEFDDEEELTVLSQLQQALRAALCQQRYFEEEGEDTTVQKATVAGLRAKIEELARKLR